jgi:hypothetical protein
MFVIYMTLFILSEDLEIDTCPNAHKLRDLFSKVTRSDLKYVSWKNSRDTYKNSTRIYESIRRF